MSKSMARDIQILLKILTYVEKMKNVLKRYQCRTSAEFAENETGIVFFCAGLLSEKQL